MQYLSFRNLGEKGGPEFSERIKLKQLLQDMKLMDGPNAVMEKCLLDQVRAIR